MGATEESKALMWRITDEIWNNGRLDLIDELIAEDLVDHVELAGLEGSGRARYRASVELTRAAFPDYRNPLDFVVAEGALAVSYGRSTGTHRGEYFGIPATGRTIDVPNVCGFCASRTVRPSNDGGCQTTSRLCASSGLMG